MVVTYDLKYPFWRRPVHFSENVLKNLAKTSNKPSGEISRNFITLPNKVSDGLMIKNRANPPARVMPLNKRTKLNPCHNCKWKSGVDVEREATTGLIIEPSIKEGNIPKMMPKEAKISGGTHISALGR